MNSFKQLVAYSRRGNPTRWISTVRFFKGALFGFNPNYPFPVTKGSERRGLVGGLLFDWLLMAKDCMRWALKGATVAILGLALALAVYPRETVGVLSPVVSPVVTRVGAYVQRLAHQSRLEEAQKVREGLYVSLPPRLSKEITASVIEAIRQDDLKVRSRFEAKASEPILIRVTVAPKVGSEAGTVTLGHYVPGSPRLFGVHSIEVSLDGALLHQTVAHELTHLMVGLLNPTTNLLLNEGLAHFMQGDLGSRAALEEHVTGCYIPAERHWSSASPRSRSDSLASRSLGYVVVHYLHVVKGIPLERIPMLADGDLPSREEIHRHLRALKLELSKARALRRQTEGIDLDFWIDAYLGAEKGNLFVAKEVGTVADEGRTFQNLMDLSVQHLRWRGVSDETIEGMSPEELMRVSGRAISTLDERIEDFGLRLGRELYASNVDGVYDSGLDRLIADRYQDTRQGRLQRAVDQGWAREYASKKLPNQETLPPYSRILLQAIRKETGDPSPARMALSTLEGASESADAAKLP